MLKFVLLVMIGDKLKMGEAYWMTLCLYALLWATGKIAGWP